MRTIKIFLCAAAIAAFGAVTPALADDNSCEGTVLVVDAWTSIEDCNFKTRSKVGQKILAICPHGTECQLLNEVPSRGGPRRDKDGLRVITKMPPLVCRLNAKGQKHACPDGASAAAAPVKMPADLIAQWCHVADGAYVAAENFCAPSRDMVFIVHDADFQIRIKGEKALTICVPQEIKTVDSGSWRIIATCRPNDNSGPVVRSGFSFTFKPTDGRMFITFGEPR